jgi:hypothetical protein
MKNILLRRKSRSQLFLIEGFGFGEQCSLVGIRWETLSQCQFLAPYPQGRDRGYHSLSKVPPLLAQCFFHFFITGSLSEISILLEGGFLSPPPPEELWVTFLLG